MHTLVFLLLAILAISCHAFKEGEYISTSRKAQFPDATGSNIRSQWHDLLGSYCPRFGYNRLVAIPIPAPHASDLSTGLKEYKLQLSFDGDRYVTQWIKIMGPGAPSFPSVIVSLRKAGEDLLGVSSHVIETPVHYLHSHSRLVDEFKNASHWPKHLLVHYHWKSEHEADLDTGLLAVMIVSLLVLMVVLVNATRGSKSKLEQFIKEMTHQDAPPLPSGSMAAGMSGVTVLSPSHYSYAKGGGKGE